MLYIFIESGPADDEHAVCISAYPMDHPDELELLRNTTESRTFQDYTSASVHAQTIANILRLGGAVVQLH